MSEREGELPVRGRSTIGGVRHGHPYQAYYCEENIWQLALRLGDPDGHVLVLANGAGAFAMWGQRAGSAPELPVVWDYHVVYARPSAAGWLVYDQDTILPFPAPLSLWLSASFLPLPAEVEIEPPRFRVMPAWLYLSRFSSDRGHMRDDAGGWVAPPPAWAPIAAGPNTLADLRDPATPGLGRVVSLSQLESALERSTSRSPGS